MTSRRRRPPDRNARAASTWSGGASPRPSARASRLETASRCRCAGRRGRPPRRDGDEEAVGGVEGEGGDGQEHSEGEQQQQRAEAAAAARPALGRRGFGFSGRVGEVARPARGREKLRGVRSEPRFGNFAGV